jgi:hypothetical protein
MGCNTPVFKEYPKAIKLAIETDSPIFHSIVFEYPPPLFREYGVIDCADKNEVVRNNRKNKIPLCIQIMLIIHLRQLKITECG